MLVIDDARRLYLCIDFVSSSREINHVIVILLLLHCDMLRIASLESRCAETLLRGTVAISIFWRVEKEATAVAILESA